MAGDEDNAAMKVELESTRVNLFNVIGFLSMFATFLVSGTTAYVMLKAAQDKADEQIGVLATEITRINSRLVPFDTYVFRQGQTENQMIEASKRTDRIVESFNGKFEAVFKYMEDIKADVGNVKSDVRVIGEALKTDRRTQPTNFKPR